MRKQLIEESDKSQNRAQQELAQIIASTHDDYIRKHCTSHGSAQAVAEAVTAAGYTKTPMLDDQEIELLKTALYLAIGRSRLSAGERRVSKSAYRSVLTRRYRLLLEKLGGPKMPVTPIAESRDEAESTITD